MIAIPSGASGTGTSQRSIRNFLPGSHSNVTRSPASAGGAFLKAAMRLHSPTNGARASSECVTGRPAPAPQGRRGGAPAGRGLRLQLERPLEEACEPPPRVGIVDGRVHELGELFEPLLEEVVDQPRLVRKAPVDGAEHPGGNGF